MILSYLLDLSTVLAYASQRSCIQSTPWYPKRNRWIPRDKGFILTRCVPSYYLLHADSKDCRSWQEKGTAFHPWSDTDQTQLPMDIHRDMERKLKMWTKQSILFDTCLFGICSIKEEAEGWNESLVVICKKKTHKLLSSTVYEVARGTVVCSNWPTLSYRPSLSLSLPWQSPFLTDQRCLS